MIDKARATRQELPAPAGRCRLPWLALLSLVPVLVACGESEVSERIGRQARETGVVDMAKAADFAWTQVRVYTPYTTGKAVCADLGALAPRCTEDVPAGVPEAEFLLVFVDEGKQSARYLPHARRNGHFLTHTGVLSLPRHAAVLEVRPAAPQQGDAIYLQPRTSM